MMSPCHRDQCWILIAMTTAVSMILFNQTAVSVAFPRIGDDLEVGRTGLRWVVNAYILAFAATVAIGGRLGDGFGLIRVFSIGTATFAVASVVCAIALSGPAIIAARVAQGLGAALMAPATSAMISNCFVQQERGKLSLFFRVSPRPFWAWDHCSAGPW